MASSKEIKRLIISSSSGDTGSSDSLGVVVGARVMLGNGVGLAGTIACCCAPEPATALT